jgi:hypothetical protein
MNPQIRAALEASGCDTALADPPTQFETTDNPIAADELFSTDDTQMLIDFAGPSPQAHTELERYWHVRQFFLKQDRAASRDEQGNAKLERIRAAVRSGDSADVLSLFRQRHVWRQHALEHLTDGRVICRVDCCPHIATTGSEFCINHILLDPSQKLFCECPSCHRPYPAMSECFACRPE